MNKVKKINLRAWWEAVLHADVMLEKIRKIGIVDGEECLQLLEKKGLDKRHRSLGSLETVPRCSK